MAAYLVRPRLLRPRLAVAALVLCGCNLVLGLHDKSLDPCLAAGASCPSSGSAGAGGGMPPPAIQYAAAFGGLGDDEATSVQLLGNNLLLSGYVQQGPITWWQSQGSMTTTEPALGPGDGILDLRETDSLGDVGHNHEGGTGGQVRFLAATATPDNKAIAVGFMSGTVNFGNGVVLQTNGDLDMLVARIGGSGTLEAAVNIGGAHRDVAFGVAVWQPSPSSTTQYAIYVGAIAGSQISNNGFTFGTDPFNPATAASTPVIIALDQTLVVRQGLGTGLCGMKGCSGGGFLGLTIDPQSGNVFATGSVHGGGPQFGATAAKANVARADDCWVAAFPPMPQNGSWSASWINRFGNPTTPPEPPGQPYPCSGTAVTTVAGGDPVVTGFFTGALSLGNIKAVGAVSNPYDEDIFVDRFSASDGNPLWPAPYHYGTAGNDRARAAATAAAMGATVAIAGAANAKFDPASGAVTAGGDVFYALLDASKGTATTARTFGVPQRATALGAALSDSGTTLYLAGSFDSTQINGQPQFASLLGGKPAYQPQGALDGFVVAISPP